MPQLSPRPWLPAASQNLVENIATATANSDNETLAQRLEALADRNRDIHEAQCINLNPATNLMNPRAEALLAAGLGSRPSLGAPGDKYEMGLEAIEEIEVIAAELAAEVFNARFAEIRVGSGALANLYGFMAICKPGDSIIVPPAAIGGHVTHHGAGAAGLYGLQIHEAPVDPVNYTVDLDALNAQAKALRPKLITIGGSLNLAPHPVQKIAEIAHSVGGKLLFDAAHLCAMIAGKTWPNPLEEGADLMTMSTYKSLGGPASGLIVSNNPEVAERLDAIAFPGLTANFDVANSAALAMTLIDWREAGPAYAAQMVDLAKTLAGHLKSLGLPVFQAAGQATTSHQFALEAAAFGGGQNAAKTLRKAGILTCGIGLPIKDVASDMNGLRFGTPEIARIGMTTDDMKPLAELIAAALKSNRPEDLAPKAAQLRQSFTDLHFIHRSKA